MNVNGLMTHLASIEYIAQIQPNLIICTESHVTDKMNDSEIALEGYVTVRSDSLSTHTAGVTIYVKNKIRFNVVEQHVFEFNNILVFDVFGTASKGRWIAIYHSPNNSHSEFLEKIDRVLESNSNTTLVTKVTGDFNINVHSNAAQSTYKRRLLNVFYKYGLKQKVKSFTRVQSDSRTIIDLMFTNDNAMKIAVDDVNQVSDHKTLFIMNENRNRSYNVRTVKDKSDFKCDKIAQKFRENFNSDAIANETDVNRKTRVIDECLVKTAGQLTRMKKINEEYCAKWYTEELRVLKNQRNFAQGRACFTNDPVDWTAYRELRNKYNREMNHDRNEQVKSDIIANSHDPKKLWRVLNKQVKNNDQLPFYIQFDDEVITDEPIIANKLNEYFIESVKQINARVPDANHDICQYTNTGVRWSEFEATNVDQIMRILRGMKSKAGIFDVNVEMVSCFVVEYPQVIVNVFNESLSSGMAPEIWKYTVITPIPKVKATFKASEMRPINSAAVLDKTLQTIVKEQLSKYVVNNSLLSEFQSAFKSDHSCESAINLVINQWKMERDQNKTIVAVFLDLRRAFETVDRQVLLQKLNRYGLEGNVLAWFETWLSGRKQYTRFKETLSDSQIIDLGIPQGTPLSCDLFNLFFNDVVLNVHHSKMNLFADDALIWISGTSLEQCVNKMNDDLNAVYEYLVMTKLSLNLDKTKAMIIGRRDFDPNCIKIDSETIEIVDKVKYLGIMVDDKLNFKENTTLVTNKIAKKTGFLSRNRKKFDRPTKLLLYKSLIAPSIDYCSSMLFLATSTEINELQRIQNRALRTITSSSIYTSVNSMLLDTNLMSIRQRINYNVLLMIYKARKNMLPSYFTAFFARVGDSQPYNLRNTDQFRPPNARTSRSQNSVIYNGALLFNEMLSYGVSTDHELNRFKRELAIYVKTKF